MPKVIQINSDLASKIKSFFQDWFQSNFEDDTGEVRKDNLKRKCSLSRNTETHEKDVFMETTVADEKLEKFQSIDWLKTFKPMQINELAIHPKKLEELRNWFKLCEKTANRILLIKGPTGCGKTISFYLVAEENDFDVIEWTNSTDQETNAFYDNSGNFNQEFVSYENQVTKFSKFLIQTSRYPSVFKSFTKRRKRLLLVKDFPNTFSRKTEEFWHILRQYSEEGQSPLVFIVSETNSKPLNIAHNLFPDNIRVEIPIDSINFNAVAQTMMLRALKRIIQLIGDNCDYSPYFKKPTDNVISSIVDNSQGDIRSAVLNLNFASQQSDFQLLVPQKSTAKVKNKKKASTKPSDGALGKNECLSLMHGLGRVFHPKLEINPTTNVKELTHKPENIAERFSSQPKNFVEMINSNYIKSFSDIHDINKVAEYFSISDCFEAEYRDSQLNQLNLDMMIRATMILNQTPATGFRPISAKVNKKWKNTEISSKEKIISASKTMNNGIIPRSNFFCDYFFFMKIISSET